MPTRAVLYVVEISLAVTVPDIALTISIIFMVGVMVLILITVNQRMLMLELQRSQLLGSVSHELRNQLTGVMGMIDLALDKNIVSTEEEVRDLIILARREAADAAGIIEDLLTASRMESNVLDVASEPVELDLEVAKIVDHYPTEGMSINHTGPRSGWWLWPIRCACARCFATCSATRSATEANRSRSASTLTEPKCTFALPTMDLVSRPVKRRRFSSHTVGRPTLRGTGVRSASGCGSPAVWPRRWVAT